MQARSMASCTVSAYSPRSYRPLLAVRMPRARLVERMAVRPREIFRLPGGSIEAGERADLAVLDPAEEYTIDPERFCSMGRSTPFAGWKVRGQAVRTMVNGRTVWEKPLTGK